MTSDMPGGVMAFLKKRRRRGAARHPAPVQCGATLGDAVSATVSGSHSWMALPAAPLLLRPDSRGTVELASADPQRRCASGRIS